jgi:hypothetical protein
LRKRCKSARLQEFIRPSSDLAVTPLREQSAVGAWRKLIAHRRAYFRAGIRFGGGVAHRVQRSTVLLATKIAREVNILGSF